MGRFQVAEELIDGGECVCGGLMGKFCREVFCRGSADGTSFCDEVKLTDLTVTDVFGLRDDGHFISAERVGAFFGEVVGRNFL